MKLRGVNCLYTFKKGNQLLYLFGERHKPSTCDASSIGVEEYIESMMTENPSLLVLVEGNEHSLTEIPEGHRSGVYHTIQRLQGNPRVHLVDIRSKMIPQYKDFEMLLSMYKYLEKHPNELSFIQRKEAKRIHSIQFEQYQSYFTFPPKTRVSFANITSALRSQDPRSIRDVLEFLKVLRDAFSVIMDRYVETLVSRHSEDIVYIAGTYHIFQLREFLFQQGYIQIDVVQTSPDQDCLTL